MRLRKRASRKRKLDDSSCTSGNLTSEETDGDDQTTVRFEDIPDVPMRIILKMLRHESNSNFQLRLVSKAVQQIVDSHVRFMVMKSGNFWKPRFDDFIYLPSELRNVKEMNLNSITLKNGCIMPFLDTLVLSHVVIWDHAAFADLLSSCSSSLRKIDIYGSFIDFSLIRKREIEMKKLKTVLIQDEGRGFGNLLSTCSQSVETVWLGGEGLLTQDRNPVELTCSFPRLKYLKLNKLELKPFLALLCSPLVLEQVILRDVDFTSIKGLQYDVTHIKDLELQVERSVYMYGNYENYLEAMFEFLCKCSARTDRIEINDREVDHKHLFPGNFTVFKENYARR